MILMDQDVLYAGNNQNLVLEYQYEHDEYLTELKQKQLHLYPEKK
jgi:hypothetical protein